MKLLPIVFLFFSINVILGQIDQLQFDPQLWPKHTVVHYVKSNWDGTNSGFVSIYFKDDQWIESIKWHSGLPELTVVPAKIDFDRFAVSHFKNIHCGDGGCHQRGQMYYEQELKGYMLQFGDYKDTVMSVSSYWHSYDFDFASLMVAFLFKQDAKDHQFERADFFMRDGQPGFGPIGTVYMHSNGIRDFKDVSCQAYTIDGPGLKNRGGEIWFDVQQNLLRGFKIMLPDEDSYRDVSFQYLSKETMEQEQWESFKRSKWNYSR